MLSDIAVSINERCDEQKEVNLTTQCMSSLFISLIGDVNAGEIKKINIFLVKENPKEDYCLEDVYFTEALFDSSEYLKLSDKEKKEKIVSIIYESIIEIARKRKWDVSAIYAAKEDIKRRGYENTVAVKKEKSSPNRKIKAQLFYRHGLRTIDIGIFFRYKYSEKISVKKLISVEPHEWFAMPYLGDLVWKSNEIIKLIPKDRSISSFEIDTPLPGLVDEISE